MHENRKNVCIGTIYNGDILIVFLRKYYLSVMEARTIKLKVFNLLLWEKCKGTNCLRYLLLQKLGKFNFSEMEIYFNILRKQLWNILSAPYKSKEIFC